MPVPSNNLVKISLKILNVTHCLSFHQPRSVSSQSFSHALSPSFSLILSFTSLPFSIHTYINLYINVCVYVYVCVFILLIFLICLRRTGLCCDLLDSLICLSTCRNVEKTTIKTNSVTSDIPTI